MSKIFESKTNYYLTYVDAFILLLMETLYDITEILRFNTRLSTIDTVEDFLKAVENGDDGCSDREPRGPLPIAPTIGSKALALIGS